MPTHLYRGHRVRILIEYPACGEQWLIVTGKTYGPAVIRANDKRLRRMA